MMTFDAAMTAFLAALTAREAAHYAAHFKNSKPGSFTTEPGRKYVRVVHNYGVGAGRSAYCFVEKSTGNIYKPAGWKAPTLNIVRGNIYSTTPTEGTNVYGTNYAWDLK